MSKNLAFSIVVTAFVAQSGFAQDAWQVPRTAYGVPDLQGVWTSASITNLERDPSLGNTLIVDMEQARQIEQNAVLNVLTDADNAPSDPDRPPPTDGDTDAGYNAFWIDPGTRLAQIDGQYRTSWIVEPENGQIPYTQAAGMAFMEYGQSTGYDGPEQRPLGERCMVGFGSSGGPPMLPVLYNNNLQIVQSEDYVMILVEMNHDARIIRLNSQHLGDEFSPWLGDSIGYWEGDTLIVETINFHPQQSFRFAIKHVLYLPPSARVIERFTRTGPDEILYEFTVEDDDAYTQPWTAQIPLRTATGSLYEYACHEGNYALPGILAGARREEREESD
ncbi:MAG: hypothetical protein OXU30_10700 [Gammaproteobacteria bacterium]|nr:hypothetical protein [Gammaproteobacteria bacterium]